MPRYDTQCQSCGHFEERIMRISETDNLLPCAECGSEDVRIVLLQAPPVSYKGGAWFSKSGSYSKPEVSRKDADFQAYDTGKV